ncbi:MAG TPA: hypothetical protein VMV49_06940 [Candidatus Deferrimicrobium sp.]|nr:hypothetical protein [Candidatus Deferrimicrobium sp.]
MSEYDIKGPNAALKEKIGKQKIYFIAKRVDQHQARTLIEQKKKNPYGRQAKNPEEIKIENVEENFNMFLRVKGKYWIRYLRHKHLEVPVQPDVEGVRVFNEIIDLGEVIEGPKKLKRNVTIDIVEKIYVENHGDLAFNIEGNSINPETISNMALEDAPSTFVDENQNRIQIAKITPELAIEKLRIQIARRPTDVQRIIDEVFDVPLIQIILSPFFVAVLNYNEIKKKVYCDAITGKVKT